MAMKEWSRKLILSALVALTILATAACGSSNSSLANSPSAVYSKTFHSCQISDLRWAKNFEATLPTPGTPADVAKLAASGDGICHDLAARAVKRASQH